MSKAEFLAQLQHGLSGLPPEEREERLDFYREMIEDRMEDGLSEEEAVGAIGPVEEILGQILDETPLSTLVRERIRPRRRRNGWVIALLVLGFPLWFSLLLAAAAVALSLYVVLWAVILSLWAAFVSLVAGAPVGVVQGILTAVRGDPRTGLA